MENNNIKWDDKAIKNFEQFLQSMYGEYGNVKFDDEHCTEIAVSQSTGEKLKVNEVKFEV